MTRDLPEGVIDADPPGGWESAAAADGETAEQSRDAEGSAALTTAWHDAESEDAAEGVDVGEGVDVAEASDAPIADDAAVASARLEAEMDPVLSSENPDDVDDDEETR